MDERECLEAIAKGADATDLLLEADPSFRRRFNAVDKAIMKLLDDVRVHFPDASYYTASGGFNLLLGKSHSDQTEASQQQLLAMHGSATIGDGDW